MSRPTADQVLAGRDLRGRAMLVTGGDRGIGFETVRALALHGARVWIGCLREEDGAAAVERLRAERDTVDVRVLAFDLGDLAQVRAAADRVDEPALNALICNAGVYGGPYAETVDGFERTFGVCYLGHAQLVVALVDRLRAGSGRVVLVSSQNHRWPLSLDVDALPIRRERYSELAAYGQAKRCVVLLSRALTDRFPGITANALHPGDLVSTGIDADSRFLAVVMRLARPFSPSAAQAAATSVHVATAPELATVSGRYFVNCREQAPASGADDPAIAARLWARTEAWLSLPRP